MENPTPLMWGLIGLGVVAVGGVGYYLYTQSVAAAGNPQNIPQTAASTAATNAATAAMAAITANGGSACPAATPSATDQAMTTAVAAFQTAYNAAYPGAGLRTDGAYNSTTSTALGSYTNSAPAGCTGLGALPSAARPALRLVGPVDARRLAG